MRGAVVTPQLEIPPEAVDAGAALSTSGRQNDEHYRAHIAAILEAAAPHFFSLFAERLTSDERFIRALHIGLLGKGWSANGVAPLDARRDLSEAVAAALVPGREDGR